MALYHLGYDAEALQALPRLTPSTPVTPIMVWSRCDISGDGARDEALVAFDRAIALRPESYLAWLAKGMTLVERQRWEEALVVLRAALERHPRAAQVCMG